MSRRIYDAAFAPSTNHSHHSHIGTYFWVDEHGNTGSWDRECGCAYVAANPKTVYVAEGKDSVWVEVYHYRDNPNVRWLQTDPDGKLKDNLLTLAKRHEQRTRNY